jgi:hypothetical protein
VSTKEGLSITLRDFSASVATNGKALVLRLTGNADMAAKEGLDALLPRLHEEALAIEATDVSVDFRELEFMNSSCFKSFVTWISDVSELSPDKQYRIRLLSKPEMHWQRRSLHALRCFAVDLISIET